MNFSSRIKRSASDKGKIILANDLDCKSVEKLESTTIKNIKDLNKFICAIKFNFHLILPLGFKNLNKINKIAHDFGLQTIADIKLNDIGNTNTIAAERLWESGFDAIIVNPIMGLDNLKALVSSTHKNDNGIITLVHMSHPGAKLGYGLTVKHPESNKQSKLYQLFLEWSLSLKTDGIVVGATVPEIIAECHKKIKNKSAIYSPGIGTQGGDAKKTLVSGANYLIVGRTIFNAKDPKIEAKKLQDLSIEN
jgi:orotidine-5'-phosphate decarboxylase